MSLDARITFSKVMEIPGVEVKTEQGYSGPGTIIKFPGYDFFRTCSISVESDSILLSYGSFSDFRPFLKELSDAHSLEFEEY